MTTPSSSSSTAPIYVVDADETFRSEVLAHFEANGLHGRGYPDATSFFRGLRQQRPACVIMDMGLPDMHGLEAQKTLVSQYSVIPLIFVADEASVPTVTEAIRMGAADFVLKPVELELLLRKTRTTLDEARQLTLRDMRKEDMRRRLHTLTAREHQILSLALTGKSNKEISLVIDISHRTVETHRAHILQKIGVANLLELAHIFADLRPYISEDREVYEPQYAAGGLH